MKLLLDTNILLDYYLRREPFFESVIKLRIAAMFNDVELWASTQSFSDIEYIARRAIGTKRLRLMMDESTSFLNLSSPTSLDLKDAFVSEWPDLEDFLIFRCAKRVKADRIITRDLKGFAESSIPVETPDSFLLWLAQDQGITYGDVDL